MYNLLLVDDEPLIKVAFQSAVEWGKNGFLLAATASNGQEALPYSRVYAAYAYADRAKDGILSLKRGHNLNFAMHLGKVLGDQIPAGAYDCIVPVPMNRQRLRERGYNQAERIGAAMGTYCSGCRICGRLHLYQEMPSGA